MNIWNFTEIIPVLSFQILHSHQKYIILIKFLEKIKEHKLKCMYVSDHIFRMLVVGGLVTGYNKNKCITESAICKMSCLYFR